MWKQISTNGQANNNSKQKATTESLVTLWYWEKAQIKVIKWFIIAFNCASVVTDKTSTYRLKSNLKYILCLDGGTGAGGDGGGSASDFMKIKEKVKKREKKINVIIF